MENDIDLTLLVPEFPSVPEVEIIKDQLIGAIGSQFTNDKQRQLLVSQPYYGKTSFLAQFCRARKSTSLSYFITDNPLTHTKRNFLFVITNQMNFLLNNEHLPSTLSISELESLLVGLSTKLSSQANSKSKIYFIVVDGIDKVINGPVGDRIVDFIPPSFSKSPYLLYSCRTSNREKLPKLFQTNFRTDDIEKGLIFNRNDTETYLKIIQLNLKSNSACARQVQRNCGISSCDKKFHRNRGKSNIGRFKPS